MTLWNSFDSVLAAVQRNGFALKYADDSLKSDKVIVFAAVQQHGCALRYADDSLKRNEQIVLAAVQQNGLALRCADDSLKSDKQIVLAAVQKERCALRYANKTLKDDEFFLSMLESAGRLRIECVSERIREEISKDPNYLLNSRMRKGARSQIK